MNHSMHTEHASHGDGNDAHKVTRAQILAMTIVSLVALAAGLAWSANYGNLTLSAHDVGGLVMPPGMHMDHSTSAQAMRDMAAVDPDEVDFKAAKNARGGQVLAPRVEAGVQVFDLEASVVRWYILSDTPVLAYAFNGQVPGPELRVTADQPVRVRMKNNLPESTSVHWHGLVLPNAMDGAAHITQEPIEPGETFIYEFTPAVPGTYFYHSHDHVDRQQALGLYGALIVEPQVSTAIHQYDRELVIQVQEWLRRDGYTFPAMPMEGAMPNYFTINGKAYPDTETVKVKVGEKVLVRFIGSSSGFIHPMHIHGGPFEIVATDGNPVPEGARLIKDTVSVAPGERYDVIWEALLPGKWLLHCHINHHTTNDGAESEGGGGLMLVIEVEP